MNTQNPVCSNDALRIGYALFPGTFGPGELKFYGGEFINADYTLNLAVSNPLEFSSGNGPGQCYKILSSDNGQMEIRVENSNIHFKHNGSDISAPFPTNVDECSVYSFVYNQQEGMKIFTNGEITSSNSGGILPLSSFSNPGIGFVPCDVNGQHPGAHEIYEVLAYKKALASSQIANLYNEIKQRHNF